MVVDGGDHTVYTLSVRATARPNRPSVTICYLNMLESLLEFHQTMQAYSYLQS